MSYTVKYSVWGDNKVHTAEIEAENILEVYKEVQDIQDFKRLESTPVNNSDEL